MVATAFKYGIFFRKAIRKFCKDDGFQLTEAHFYCLFAVYCTTEKQMRGASVADVQGWLKKTDRRYGTNSIAQYLKKLTDCGLLESKGSFPVRYNMTLVARNSINDIEKQLRKSRKDR